MADLLAYVNALPDRPCGRSGDRLAERGGCAIIDLGCIGCHTILETDPDLMFLPPEGRAYTLTGLAVAMWNHQPVMRGEGGDGVRFHAWNAARWAVAVVLDGRSAS
ncbi:MAG: hypothetical protein R2724_21580 [Bryobacterales bacterium]